MTRLGHNLIQTELLQGTGKVMAVYYILIL